MTTALSATADENHLDKSLFGLFLILRHDVAGHFVHHSGYMDYPPHWAMSTASERQLSNAAYYVCSCFKKLFVPSSALISRFALFCYHLLNLFVLCRCPLVGHLCDSARGASEPGAPGRLSASVAASGVLGVCEVTPVRLGTAAL